MKLSIRNGLAVLLSSWCATALAEPKLAVISTGDCRNASLIAGARDLSQELQRRMPERVIDEPAVARQLGSVSSRPPEELSGQIDAAYEQFFTGRHSKAEKQAIEIIVHIDRLPPGDTRWQLWVRSQLLLGLCYRGMSRTADAGTAFKRVLAVKPDLRLNEDIFSPSAREFFEQLRGEIKKSVKSPLVVKSTPPGVEVFIQGLKVGTTPFYEDYVAGNYQLALTGSLSRLIQLPRDGALQIDVGFEASISPQHIACINTEADENSRLSGATWLGTHLGAQEVVVVRLDRSLAGNASMAALLLNIRTGQKGREGSLADARSDIGQLATFLLTGQLGDKVKSDPVTLPKDVQKALPPPSEGPIERPEPIGRGRTWLTGASAAVVGVGLIAAAFGVALQFESEKNWKQFNEFYSNRYPSQAEVGKVKQLQDGATTNTTFSITSYVLSGVCLAVGGTIFFWEGARAHASNVVLTVGPTGAAVRVRF